MFLLQKRNGDNVMHTVLANSYGGHHFEIYKCIKSMHHTPQTYIVSYVNYISIKLGEKRSFGGSQL